MIMLTTGDESLVAAHDAKEQKLVLVLLNDGNEEREWRIDLGRFEGRSLKASGWITETAGKARYQAVERVGLQGKMLVLRQVKKSVQTVVVGVG
jgi:hypothetical protein